MEGEGRWSDSGSYSKQYNCRMTFWLSFVGTIHDDVSFRMTLNKLQVMTTLLNVATL